MQEGGCLTCFNLIFIFSLIKRVERSIKYSFLWGYYKIKKFKIKTGFALQLGHRYHVFQNHANLLKNGAS